jgi:hypothetical protein
MSKLRVHNIAVSLDGYAAGPRQDRDHPLGVGGEGLHEWVFETGTGRQMIGMDGGDEGVDDEFIARGESALPARRKSRRDRNRGRHGDGAAMTVGQTAGCWADGPNGRDVQRAGPVGRSR